MLGNRENELLVTCLRREEESSKIEKLSKLSSPDWETIFQSSIRHDVAPLLYHRLKSLKPEALAKVFFCGSTKLVLSEPFTLREPQGER